MPPSKVKVKMETDTKLGVEEYDACRILAEVNDCESIIVLKSMKWNTTGKKDFLMGKITSTICSVAEPLTEAEADQAIKEYHDLGYC